MKTQRYSYVNDEYIATQLLKRAFTMIKNQNENYVCFALENAAYDMYIMPTYADSQSRIDQIVEVLKHWIQSDLLRGIETYEDWLVERGYIKYFFHTTTLEDAKIRKCRLNWIKWMLQDLNFKKAFKNG